MSSIQRAREALLKGDAENALLTLQSETGLDAPIVAFGLTVDGFVDRGVNESLSDVLGLTVPASLPEQVKEELWKSFAKRYGDWDPRTLRALGLHMSGVQAVDAAKELGVDPKGLQLLSAKKGFLAERKWVLGQIANIVSDFVVTDLKVEAQLRPIVKKLGRKALDSLDDVDGLSSKEALKAFQELGKLLAQVTGELVEKKQIDIGPTEQFMAIMEAAEKMPKEAIEVKDWKLIE
jgi:hypothetical protein